MAEKRFYMDFNVKGAERKRLAQAVSAYMGEDSKYLGAPTFSYEAGGFTIDRNGVVSFDGREDAEGLAEALENEGFVSQVSNLGYEEEENETESADETFAQDVSVGLTVSIPLDKVAAGNLMKLLDAKGSLIRKALGIDSLPVEIGEDTISFPWFAAAPEPEEAKAYIHLIAALCEMSKNQKRVTATEKEVDNEKYAFRCFLLRLGFIGAEYKTERKVLLQNLSGSSAFKDGQRKEPQDSAVEGGDGNAVCE